MAAPMRHSCFKINFKRLVFEPTFKLQNEIPCRYGTKRFIQRSSLNNDSFTKGAGNGGSRWMKRSLLLAGTLAGGYATFKAFQAYKRATTVFAKDATEKPTARISRSVRYVTDASGLKLTLFQFQTCPFCCKVRATLDYYGISYDIVEVNSVLKSQIKWSDYRKVPILICDGIGPNGFLQINDSSVIISILETHLFDKTQPLELLKTFYPGLESKDKRGKSVWEFQNKYFIMYQDSISDIREPEERSEERKWRAWTDDVFVHILSPNAYRTPKESLQAFEYFSDVGEWKKNFSTPERLFIIYVGATVMYFVSKLLKKRHGLKEDVRESLYDAARDWTKAIGRRKFLGGDQPNLADLSVYGVLNSIEGCVAFQDMINNTKIGPWFYRTKEAIQSHQGSNPLTKKR